MPHLGNDAKELLVGALIGVGRVGTAGKLIVELIRGATGSAALKRYAELAMQSGMQKHAKRVYSSLLTRDPHNPELMKRVAMIAISDGKPDIARPLLTRLANKRPDDWHVLYMLGEVINKLPDWRNSNSYYRRALRRIKALAKPKSRRPAHPSAHCVPARSVRKVVPIVSRFAATAPGRPRNTCAVRRRSSGARPLSRSPQGPRSRRYPLAPVVYRISRDMSQVQSNRNAAPQALPRRRRLTGWFAGFRSIALFEIVVFLAICLGVDWLWFDGTRFADVSPHPFWIVVLLISVGYGSVEGLVAAALSSAALLVGNLPPQTISADLFEWQLAVAARPMMWMTAAVLLGEIASRNLRRIEHLGASLEEAESSRAQLSQTLVGVQQAHRQLELSVAAETHLERAIQSHASRLFAGTVDGAIEGTRELLAAALKPDQFSIYLLRQGRLCLVHAEGWKSPEQYPIRLAEGDPLFDEVIGRRRDLSVGRPDDIAILDGHGVLAAPLLAPDRKVLGMLKVERMPFRECSYGSLSKFRSICDLVATAFANVQQLRTLPVGSTAQDLPASTSEGRGGTHSGPVSLSPVVKLQHAGPPGLVAIQIRVAPDSLLAHSKLLQLFPKLERICRSTLPSHAIVVRHGKKPPRLFVLLPGATEAEARERAKAIEGLIPSRLSSALAKQPLIIETSVLAPSSNGTIELGGPNVVPLRKSG